MIRWGFTLIELLVVIPLVSRRKPARRGFTLIELLVVIAIVAVLAVVVILVLNPAALIQQSRDSNRLSDVASINSALSLYLADASINGTVSLGSSSVVYVSLADPTATSTAGDHCEGLGLLTLPPAYSYHCASSSTYRMTNATGWIPVNFAAMSNGSPFGQLPVDPTNTSSSRLYYTYTTNGSQHEVTAVPESSKYKLGGAADAVGTSGSSLATVMAKGTNLSLEPLDYGDSSLAGYWTFDEGAGTAVYDYSGNNATGTWSGTGTHWISGKIGSYSGQFATTTSDYVNISNAGTLNVTQFTVAYWWNPAGLVAWAGPIGNRLAGKNGFQIVNDTASLVAYTPHLVIWNGTSETAQFKASPISSLPFSDYVYVVWTYDGTSAQLYANGIPQATTSSAITSYGPTGVFLGRGFGYTNGPIDDVRIYSRALSVAEVAALYAGAK